jgi:hypothetical protein
MNEYSAGDFGEATFRTNKKGFSSRITTYGTIKAVEKKVLWFTDNDGFDYLVERRHFEFERKEFEDKSKQ